MRSRAAGPAASNLLNHIDSRAGRWHLFGEMNTMRDADQVSRSLIAETDGAEGPWRNYARIFLTSLLHQLHRVQHDDVGELYSLNCNHPRRRPAPGSRRLPRRTLPRPRRYLATRPRSTELLAAGSPP